MPTYIHDGTAWKEIVSTSTSVSTGGNIYVRTSGSGSLDETRLTGIDIHDGTGWKSVYTGYVATAPPKPSTPTWTTSRPSGWNTRIDTTRVSWNSVSGITGYILEIYDGSYNPINSMATNNALYYNSGVTNSGNISIDPGGNTYYFKVYAYTTNVDNLTSISNGSTYLRVVSGRTNVSFSTSKADNFTSESSPFSWNFSKSANATNCRVGVEYAITKSSTITDELVPGYLVVNSVTYTLTYVTYSLASSTRAIYFNGDGLTSQAYETSNGYGNLVNPPIYSSPAGFSKEGGGTYKVTAAGAGWGTTQTNCQPGSPTALLSGFTVSGYQTTANTT